jgi:hypothetical protein
MRIDTGTYTGDAVAGGKVISLTNCSGDCSSVDTVILIVPEEADDEAHLSSNSFDTDYAKPAWGSGVQTNTEINSLGSGQFEVDGHLNISGALYLYLVLQYDGSTRNIETGFYTGNGLDDQNGLMTFTAGFTPNAAFVMREDTRMVVGRDDSEGAAVDDTCYFNNTVAYADRIQQFQNGYCQIGANQDVNTDTRTYQYFVLGEVTNYADFFEWVGNGTDPTNITGSLNGADPDFVFILHDRATKMCAKEATSDGVDDASLFDAVASAANHIQDLIANGIEVGSGAYANGSGSEYYGLFFVQYAGTAAAGVDVQATTNSLTLTGFTASAFSEISVQASANALSLSALTTSVLVHASVQTTVNSLTLSALTASISGNASVQTTSNALTLSLLSPTIAGGASVQTTTQATTLTANTVVISGEASIQTTANTMTITVNNAVVEVPGEVQLTVQTLTITAPTVTVDTGILEVPVTAQQMTITLQTPTVEGGATIQQTAQGLTITSLTPSTISIYPVTAQSLALAAQTAVIETAGLFAVSSQALTITPQNVSIIFPGLVALGVITDPSITSATTNRQITSKTTEYKITYN